MKDRYLSVEEALIKTGQTCKICNCPIHLIPDKEGPVHYFKHHQLTDGTKAFSIGFGLVKHLSGLCYYHLKKKQGLFDTEAIYKAKQELYCNGVKDHGGHH